jgi:osmotically-inducible protein OsmY
MKSDSELRQDVLDELARVATLQADDIDVQASAGVVTLTGKVGSDLEKWNAEDAVRGMRGVKGLLNETLVVTEAPGQQLEGDIARPWFP